MRDKHHVKSRYCKDVNRAGRGKCVAVCLTHARAFSKKYRAVQVCGDAVSRKPDSHATREIFAERGKKRGKSAARDAAGERSLPLDPELAAKGDVVDLRALEPARAFPRLADLRQGGGRVEREDHANFERPCGTRKRRPS